MAAQDLVMRARGVLRDRGWRISNERLGSGDDISVYIIPLLYGNQQPLKTYFMQHGGVVQAGRVNQRRGNRVGPTPPHCRSRTSGVKISRIPAGQGPADKTF
ncbi:hypothetical protein SKAU_G00044440 [Synaphobranchus kaupii]|uniref:Uncharacterized protein n=1 Tax=Synaphobranchus kaupii TaxID=118154 RepID=A0A9Q1G1T6_SYNKA|nr:hypothetical protein SKAU_G00044440 [Synaphobranchus kaupii]